MRKKGKTHPFPDTSTGSRHRTAVTTATVRQRGAPNNKPHPTATSIANNRVDRKR